MSLENSLNRLNEAARRSEYFANRFEERIILSKSEWEMIGNQAITKIRGDIIAFLLVNYAKSGLRVRTGKLKGAINSSKVSFVWKGSRPKIAINMPAGVSPYTNGKTKSDFYVVAGAQNYGAVISDNDFGAKAKKTIKKKVLKGSKNISSKGYVFNKSTETNKSTSITSAGGAKRMTIIKPRDFYKLTSSQENIIGEKFLAEVKKLVSKKIRS